MERKCITCQKLKNLEKDFYIHEYRQNKNKDQSVIYKYTCKECVKAARKNKYMQDKNKAIARSIKYRKTFRGYISHKIEFANRKFKNNKLTLNEVLKKFEEFNFSCAYCGVSTPKLTIDHKVSYFYGGTNTIDNIVPCCVHCNSSKGIKLWEVKTYR